MHLAPDPDADPYTVRAACLTCAQRSPAPDPAGTLADQHEQAQQWCLEHVARDHPDGRHLRYTATFTLRWRITPGEEIGPAAP
ncbi:hypothetical protein AAHZ94_08145 [Streptomyces sp. HSW2009]|uniref:DUF7848 domain-containing protein n=1 Tax=Streptomyces sp. HSW2009 TaxID=3142890 RepID=UPI0032EF43EC